MNREGDSPIVLPKWPFYVGDALLVFTALAIATLHGWQLNNWQVFSCVTAVAFGAALFVLPFIVEYQTRLKDESEFDGEFRRRIAERIDRIDRDLHAMGTRFGEMSVNVHEVAGSYESTARSVEEKISAVDDLIADLEKARKEDEAALAKLKKSAASAVDQKAVDALGERLGVLDKRLAELAKRLDEFAASVESDLKALADKQRMPSVKRRERKPARLAMLRRALKQDSPPQENPAVSRIIREEPKVKPEPPAPKPEPEDPVPVPEEPEAEAASAKPKAATKPEKATAKKETVPAAEPKVEEPPPSRPPFEELADGVAVPIMTADDFNFDEASEDEKPGEEAPKKNAKPKDKEPPGAKAPELAEPVESETAPVAGEGGDLFGEVGSAVPGKARIKKTDTAVVANVLIGIGNKPFIRGEGGGLSWDEGVAMDFQEIGKWRWIAPDGSGPVEFQIYRNDEDPDAVGRHSVEEGQQIEIEPRF